MQTPVAPVVIDAKLATQKFSVAGLESNVESASATKEIAFTFDADMTPHMLELLKIGAVANWYDKKVVDALTSNNLSATFFITGLWAETYPNIVRELAANPKFEIGNHSYDHAAFQEPCYGLSQANDKKFEIQKTQAILESLTGKTPKLFRFPGGCRNEADISLAHAAGLTTVNWDAVSGDAYFKDPDRIVEKVLAEVRDGAIIVMHVSGGPFAPASGEALEKLIPILQKQGYVFKTASDLIRDFDPEVLR